jgi:iron complex outermembrane receptor protein
VLNQSSIPRVTVFRDDKTLHAMALAPLMALAISGCLIAAMPLRAAAEEQAPASEAPAAETQGTEDSQDSVLDDLFGSAEASAAPEATAADAQPPTAQSEPAGVEALLPVIAVPQQATPTPPLKEPPSSATQLEEIVVTATKRAANVREIPASIAAISGDELEQRGAQDTADIVKLVPGVNLTSTGDSPQRITIRGISSDIGTGPTTGILFGNVSFTETFAPVVALDPNPFDMASVEILKGPQGTLFGGSALNGAVRYVPTPPRFDEFEVKWFGQYTSIHEGDAAPTYGAAVNLPLYSDALALRVMAFDRTAPGYIDNTRIDIEDTNETRQQGARALLGWRPDGDWDVLLTTAWQDTKIEDVGIADNGEGRLETNDRPRQSPNHTEYSMANLTVTYDSDWAQFVSDTSYIQKDGRNLFDATSRSLGNGALPLIAQYYRGDSTTYGQEFRLVSPEDSDSRWKWVAGLFAWQQNLENTLTVPLAVELTPLTTIIDMLNLEALSSLFADGSPVVLQTVGDVEVREFAAFGEVTRRIGDDVELALGGRFYRTTSGGTNTQSGAFILAQSGQSPNVLEGEIAETGFNPKASLLWHVNDDILTYGLVSKGFRVGGIQSGLTTPLSANPAPDTYKSDTLWNYELGIRTQFFDNTLRLDLTGFWVDWQDPQSLQPDASGLAVYVDNVGGVRSRGADLSLQYLLPFGVMFTTAVSYADTVTTEDFTTSDGTVYAAGADWPLAPKWQTSSNLSFMLPIDEWTLGGFATYSAIGPTVPVFGFKEVFDYHQLDLQLSVANQRLSWLPQVALILNNVTDERGTTNYFSSGIPTAESAAEEYYYITPRSVTVRLMGSFGN